MLKEKSNQWAKLKALLFIPPTAMLMLAFARPETALLEAAHVSNDKVIQILEENQPGLPIVEERVAGNAQKDVLTTSSENGVGISSNQENLQKVIGFRSAVSDSSEVLVVAYASNHQESRKTQDSVKNVVFTLGQEKGSGKACKLRLTPPPPSPLISLVYKDKEGKAVRLSAYSEEQFAKNLNVERLSGSSELTLQLNRQRTEELQNRIIQLLKEKGVKQEIKIVKGEAAPPLAPLQMTFVYKSGQKMYKDVWIVSNAENFIDHTPVNKVNEVILTLTPNCKDEMKKSIRDYLTQKGFTQISERQLEYN